MTENVVLLVVSWSVSGIQVNRAGIQGEEFQPAFPKHALLADVIVRGGKKGEYHSQMSLVKYKLKK